MKKLAGWELEPDMWLVREPCEHIKRKVGEGADGAIAVDAWECSECGQTTLAMATPDRVVPEPVVIDELHVWGPGWEEKVDEALG